MPGETKSRRIGLRQTTQAQVLELKENKGIIGNYLKSLQRKLLEDDLVGRQRNMFSSTLFLLSWLNKNTNIDLVGLKEILNGAYTVIENDNGDLYYKVCQLAKQERDIERGTAPYFVAGKRISRVPESSHYSCPSRKEKTECKTPHDKDQIRMGQGLLYDCNERGLCNRNKSSSYFDLIIGVQCNDDGAESGNTWFQFEYARLTGSTIAEKVTNKYLLHVYSFLCYAASFCTKNQGTFGTSKFVENGRHYRLLMNSNNGKNITSSNDRINNLNILTPSKLEEKFEKNRKKPIVFTISGGRKTKKKKGGHHLYKTLGLSKYSTQKQIKSRYKKLKKNKKITKKIKHAYKILSNKKTRKMYNNKYKKYKK